MPNAMDKQVRLPCVVLAIKWSDDLDVGPRRLSDVGISDRRYCRAHSTIALQR
ncbi:hypothetical protein ZHAS_00006623 [Anopheles sinensis]|uniref:Uncharacterized protein n=1 Tax=Anopheles sinensis TaxID=74873 RepID=A0A084VMS8_ANOSI|nr:hypothetical protein ZHAS_00006623 [Anopheles sinensis]